MMKAKIISYLLFALMLLSSCGSVDSSFFNKTFLYYENVYFNFDYEDTRYATGKNLSEVLREQIANDNIDWNNSGRVLTGEQFEKHNDLEEVIMSMKDMSLPIFDETYKDLKIYTSDSNRKIINITIPSQQILNIEYNLSQYENNQYYQYIKDSQGNIVGHIALPKVAGFNIYNGIFPCIDFEFNTKISSMDFVLSFKEKVNGQTNYTWSLYAKISN